MRSDKVVNWADKWHVAVTGSIALMVMLALCYMVIQQQPVPDLLQGIAWTILGYFFGAQTQKVANNRNNAAKARARAAAAKEN